VKALKAQSVHTDALIFVQCAYQEVLDELVEEDDLHSSSPQRQLHVERMHVEVFLTRSCIVVQRHIQLKDVVATERQDLHSNGRIHTAITYYRLTNHSMMHSESEDISSNYLTAYINFTNNLSL